VTYTPYSAGSDPVNIRFEGISHMNMLTSYEVYEVLRDLVRTHNRSKP